MSAHDSALRALRSWTAPSAAQDQLRRRYVAHLEDHEAGLRRECLPDHLTASTLVLDHDRTHALLTLHGKARRWFQLGGHVEDADASLVAAALREATEESGVAGLRIDPTPVQLSEHPVPFCGAGGDTHHLDVRFVAVAPAAATHAVSEESLDVRWWPLDALPDPDDDMVELATLARERATGPDQSWGGGEIRDASDQPRR